MKDKKRDNRVFSRLIGDSRIWSRFFSGKNLSLASSEALLKEDTLLKNGAVGYACGAAGKYFSRVRSFCALQAEQSKIMGAFSRLLKGLTDTSVGSVGVFLFFTAIYAAVVCLFNLFVKETGDPFELYISAALAFLGLILIPLRKSLLTYIQRGLLFSHFAEDLLGISRFALHRESAGVSRTGKAILLATALGIAGFFVSPFKILGAIALILLFCCVVYSPEGGLLLAAFTLPLAPYYIPCIFAVTAGVGYIYKLLVGKRNFYLSAADIFMLLLFLSALVAAVFTPFTYENTGLLLVTAAFLYILCSNLIRSSEQLAKLCGAFNSGGLIVAFCCIFSRFLPRGVGIFGDIIDSLAGREEILLVLLPCTLASAFLRGFFSAGTMSVAAIYAAAALTFSENNYLLAIIITALFLVCAFRKRAGIILGSLSVCGGIFVLFSLGLIDGEMAVGNFGDISQWEIALKYLVSGAGMGSDAFTFAFRSGGYSGAGEMNLYGAVAIAGGGGMLVLLGASLILLLRRGATTLRGKTEKQFKYPAAAAVSSVCTLLLLGALGGWWQESAYILSLPIMCGCLSGLTRIYEREAVNENESY